MTWSVRVGLPPLVVTAWERSERGGRVFARWTDPARLGRERRVKRCLDCIVRDESGRVDPALVSIAESRVTALYVELRGGMCASADGALTLREGIAKALAADGSGLYPVESRHLRDVRRLMKLAVDVLGQYASWKSLTSARIAALWRHMAREWVKTKLGGPRQSEVAVASLHAIAQWLRDNELIPSDACRPRKGWRALLAQDWAKITGMGVEVSRPRHTVSEHGRIWEHLGRADPRARLLVELGAELRLGQVLRVRRSDYADLPSSFAPYGTLMVRGAGKKKGELVVLTSEQAVALTTALNNGHLSDLERRYREAELDDYQLFPAGKLKRGLCSVAGSKKPMHRRSALTLFHEVEALAGVPTAKGRGWLGMRRVAADLAPGFEHDDRVLDRLGGHSKETRERIYQERKSLELAAAAAALRANVRRAKAPGDAQQAPAG